MVEDVIKAKSVQDDNIILSSFKVYSVVFLIVLSLLLVGLFD